MCVWTLDKLKSLWVVIDLEKRYPLHEYSSLCKSYQCCSAPELFYAFYENTEYFISLIPIPRLIFSLPYSKQLQKLLCVICKNIWVILSPLKYTEKLFSTLHKTLIHKKKYGIASVEQSKEKLCNSKTTINAPVAFDAKGKLYKIKTFLMQRPKACCKTYWRYKQLCLL